MNFLLKELWLFHPLLYRRRTFSQKWRLWTDLLCCCLSINNNNNDNSTRAEEKSWEHVNNSIISHQPTFHVLFPKAACQRSGLPQATPAALLTFILSHTDFMYQILGWGLLHILLRWRVSQASLSWTRSVCTCGQAAYWIVCSPLVPHTLCTQLSRPWLVGVKRFIDIPVGLSDRLLWSIMTLERHLSHPSKLKVDNSWSPPSFIHPFLHSFTAG